MKIIDSLSFIGQGRYKNQSVEELIQRMDQNGVEKALIAPVDEYVVAYNTEGNLLVQAACAAYPDRFIGYAVANPWFGNEAVNSLKRALENGLSAVYFDSSIQGFPINDHIIDPLMNVCKEYNVPAYFHTGTPLFALPFNLHYLAIRHPDVRFLLGHLGANDFVSDALPSLYGRDNIWLETSLALTPAMTRFMKVIPDRVVFGSCSPRSEISYELKKLRYGEPEQSALEKALSKNIETVLGVNYR